MFVILSCQIMLFYWACSQKYPNVKCFLTWTVAFTLVFPLTFPRNTVLEIVPSLLLPAVGNWSFSILFCLSVQALGFSKQGENLWLLFTESWNFAMNSVFCLHFKLPHFFVILSKHWLTSSFINTDHCHLSVLSLHILFQLTNIVTHAFLFCLLSTKTIVELWHFF